MYSQVTFKKSRIKPYIVLSYVVHTSYTHSGWKAFYLDIFKKKKNLVTNTSMGKQLFTSLEVRRIDLSSFTEVLQRVYGS